MTNVQEELTVALQHRADNVVVEDHLESILGGHDIVRFSDDHTPHRGRNRVLAVAAGVAVLLGAAGLAWANGNRTQPPAASSPSQTPNDSPSDRAQLEPVVTLPASGDITGVPVTVLGAQPADWFRLAPDLDVAWYQDQANGAASMVCWRTPAGSDCEIDTAKPGEPVFAVPTSGGQSLVVMIGTEPRLTTLDVVLGDGTVLGAPISWNDTINWGVARFAAPDATAIERIGDPTPPPSDSIVGG